MLRARTSRGTPLLAAGTCAVAVLAALLGGSASNAATSGSVVGATVPSSSTLDASNCATGTPATDFGSLAAGSSVVTSADCRVIFGSSNDTAMLRIAQADGGGPAMWLPPTGPLDTVFGAGTGKLTTDFTAGQSDEAWASVVQPDGKVLVAGRTLTSNSDFAVARYLADGTLDTTFDTDGKQSISFTAANDTAYDILLQPDGRIVLAGECNTGAGSSTCLARLTSSGALDTTFNTTGRFLTTLGTTSWALSAALQPDGKILASGGSWNSTDNDFAIIRLLPDGTLDTTFNGTGKVVTPLGGGEVGETHSLEVQPDGRIIMGGFRNNDWALVRYLPDGTLDTSFNGTGSIVRSVGAGSDHVHGIHLNRDGTIVVTGMGNNAGNTNADFVAVRFTSAGALDPTFGTAGTTIVAVGAGNDFVDGALLQPDERIVLYGGSVVGASSDFAAVRLLRSGALDTTFNGTGTKTVSMGAGNDEAYGAAWGRDGRLLLVGKAPLATSDFGVAELGSTTVLDYGGGGDWSAGANAFGACLRAVAAGATTDVTTWSTTGTCPAANGTNWQGVSGTPAKVALSPSGNNTAEALLRFGFRAATTQAPGTYLAPVTFEVVAPAS